MLPLLPKQQPFNTGYYAAQLWSILYAARFVYKKHIEMIIYTEQINISR